MKFIERLGAKGDDLIDSRGEEWLGDLIEEARVMLPDDADDEMEEAANSVLDELDKNRKPFVGLGKVGFAYLLGHWEDGDEAEARRKYLEREATFEERRAAMQAAGDQVVAIRKAREEQWAKVVTVLKTVGEIGVKFLIKIVGASLGI